jgi:hypothetical protein
MLIPSKFSGYSFDGSRRCFGGGGGGGGGDGTNNDVYTPAYTPPTNTNTNVTNTGNTAVSTTTTPFSNMAVNTQQGYNTLAGMKGTPWGQSGSGYNELLNQGFTSGQIKDSASQMYGAPSDSNWGMMVQNAAMTSPTGRPMAGSDQFFQPVYNTSYQNYARPATQFDVSSYGTQPSNSPAFNSGMSRGAINQSLNNFYNTNYRDNPNGVGMGDTLDFMRQNGINRDDFQTWGGVKNYGPQTSAPSMQTQMQQQFNPYSNNSGFNGQLMTAGYGGFGSPMGGLSPFVTNPTYQMQQPYNPFSYQQSSYGGYQPSYGGYSGYGMQSPFSYQQQAQPAIPPNYGPSQAIVGRSSQMRGTPNVMRRAEGGIASLMDDVE